MKKMTAVYRPGRAWGTGNADIGYADTNFDILRDGTLLIYRDRTDGYREFVVAYGAGEWAKVESSEHE